MAYGIDDVVQKKVDAYRGNPAALQQRYAQNQELVDLLALQKMKSEKESAAREVSMQMQNNPNTIAKQREQEVLGLTKNEMVKQTGDILKQRQAKQQSNMARMAQSGIASRANAPRMMAEGGIVAFAQGDRVNRSRDSNTDTITQDMIDAYRNRAGQGRRARTAMSDDEIRQILAKQQLGTPSITNRNTLPGTRRADAIALADAGMTNIDTAPTVPPAPPVEPPVKPPVEPPKPPVTPPAEPYTTPQLGKGLGAITAPTARTQYLDGDYSVGMSDASSTADAQAGIKSLMDQKPKDVREEAMTYGLEQLGMSDDRVAAEKARQKALADLDKRQLAGNQREELSAFLRGTAQAGSLAGGSAAAANVRGQQQLAERNRLLGRQQGERDFEGLQQDIKVKAFDAAKSAFEIANQNVRQGVSSMTQFNATEVGLLSDNAKRLLDTDVANMEAEDRDAKRILDAQIANASNETKVAVANLEASVSDRRTTLQNQMEKAKLGQLDRKDTNTLLNQVEKYQADVRAKYQKVYQDAIAALPFGEDNKAAEDALKVEMTAAINIALEGLAQRTKDLEAYLASLPSADGFGDLQ